MKDVLKRLRSKLAETMGRRFRRGATYAVEKVHEIPDHVEGHTLYLVGLPKPWSAALLCPCGCGEVIHISLLKDEEPSWRLYLSKTKGPSLAPSIWRTEGCRSHFFLRSGRIEWFRAKDLSLETQEEKR
jgi:hypothetical protein